MIQLSIDNKEIESFYNQECNGDKATFINNLSEYVEAYNIKKSIQQGMKEVREIQEGKRKGQDLESFLNEL